MTKNSSGENHPVLQQPAKQRGDQKQIEAAEQIYRLLAIADDACDQFLRLPGHPLLGVYEERFKKTKDALDSFLQYFKLHRIYFKDDTCELLNSFHTHAWAAVSKVDAVMVLCDPNDHKARLQAVESSTKDYLGTVPDIRRALERKFKSILQYDRVGDLSIGKTTTIPPREQYDPLRRIGGGLGELDEQAAGSKSTSEKQAQEILTNVSLSLKEVLDALKAVPPFQRSSVAKHYIGLPVEWSGAFASAEEEKDGIAKVMLNIKTGETDYDLVFCYVKLSSYPQIRVLKVGAPMRVQGQIERLEHVVVIGEATLTFLPQHTEATEKRSRSCDHAPSEDPDIKDFFGRWTGYGVLPNGQVGWRGEFIFHKNGSALATDQGPARHGTWTIQGDRIVVHWPNERQNEVWDEFMLPIRPEGIEGRSWTGGRTYAVKIQ